MRVMATRPVGRTEAIRWRRIDQWGAFAGEFYGSIDQLSTHLLAANALDRSLWDVAQVSVADHTELYLCDADLMVECTVVSLLTPWGNDRFVPADLHRR